MSECAAKWAVALVVLVVVVRVGSSSSRGYCL